MCPKLRLCDVTYGFQIQDIRICMGLTIIFPIRLLRVEIFNKKGLPYFH